MKEEDNVQRFQGSDIGEPRINPDAIINPKTIEIFTGFAVTLKRIHVRLVMEGYTIKAGKIYKPGEYKDHEPCTENNPTDNQ